MDYPLPPPNILRNITGSDSLNGSFFFAAGVETEESLMPGAGAGLFTAIDVKTGGLLVSLRQPLLLIAKGTKGKDCKAPLELLAKTCDYCFSSFDTENQASATTTGDDLVLLPCDGCRVLHYCNTEFRNCSAEDHHHSVECSTLKRIRKQWHGPGGIIFDKKRLPVEDECLRGVVRLLCSRKGGEVSDDEIATFLGLGLQVDDKKPIRILYNAADAANNNGQISMRYENIDHSSRDRASWASRSNFGIMCETMFTHRLIMAHPTIGGTSSDFAEAYTKTGFCFDTFAANFNHSCTPNVTFFFNKFELQCRAARNIKAGEELTIAYDAHGYNTLMAEKKPSRNHYKTFWDGNYRHRRRDDLHAHYGFWCTCELCRALKLGPNEGEISFYPSLDLFEDHEVYEKLQLIGAFVKDKGYNLTSFPMKETYDSLIAQSARFKYTSNQGGKEYRAILSRLKACLTLFFLIEPNYEVSIPMDNRIFTIQRITLALRLAIEVDTERKEMYSVVLAGFHFKLYKSVVVCFGYDSQIREEEFSLCKSEVRHTGWNKDQLEMEFDRHLRKLLSWAGFSQIQIERVDKSTSAIS